MNEIGKVLAVVIALWVVFFISLYEIVHTVRIR